MLRSKNFTFSFFARNKGGKVIISLDTTRVITTVITVEVVEWLEVMNFMLGVGGSNLTAVLHVLLICFPVQGKVHEHHQLLTPLT